MSSVVPNLAQPSDPAGTPAAAGPAVAHGHQHAGGPGRQHRGASRGASRGAAHLPGVSVLRASLGARLAVVAVLCTIMWAAILWVVA